MSVTIVSTMPRPTQATATDNVVSSGNTTSGDNAVASDFASLLLRQLKPIVPAALETAQTTTGQKDLAIPESAPTDATALLTALQFTPQESSRKDDIQKLEEASPQDKNKDDNTVSDISASTPNAIQAAALAQGLEAVVNTTNTKNTELEDAPLLGIGKSNNTTLGSASTSLPTSAITVAGMNLKDPVNANSTASGTTPVEDRPAKFAAVTAIMPASENASTKIVTADTSSIPPLVGSTQGNPNAPAIRHEASLSVPTPLRDQGWASDFGQKIVWLASNDKQSAQITLNPPQMGPIEISLSMDKGSATASFTSANSEVRNALETAMPKLREMFASAGIELGQTNVSAESFKQQAENGNANRGSSQWRSDNAILGADSAISLSARAFSAQRGNGLVDIFA